MKKPVNIGIIGLGRWGTNYFRTFNGLENCDVKYICSAKKTTLEESLKKVSPSKKPKSTLDYNDILDDKDIDAVAIATPGSMHFRMAKKALQANKHVLVDKPLAFTSKDASELISMANKKNRALMVGHQHLFNPGIQRLKSDMGKGLFGKINSIYLAHFGNGPVRTDMSALWDFFPHSVSIFLYLLEELPASLSVNGQSCINKGVEDMVTMDAIFPGKIFAVSVGSWLYPIKKMEMTIVGEKMYAVFDDYAESEKLKYYRSRPKFANGKIIIRDEGYEAPKLKNSRPLTEELAHFLDCVQNNKRPLTGGKEALDVTKVLEAAQESLSNNGKRVEIK